MVRYSTSFFSFLPGLKIFRLPLTKSGYFWRPLKEWERQWALYIQKFASESYFEYSIEPSRRSVQLNCITPNLPIWPLYFYGMVKNIYAILSSGITEYHSKALHNKYIFDDPTLFQVNVSKNIVPKAHDCNNLYNTWLVQYLRIGQSRRCRGTNQTIFFFYTCSFAKTGTKTDHGEIASQLTSSYTT